MTFELVSEKLKELEMNDHIQIYDYDYDRFDPQCIYSLFVKLFNTIPVCTLAHGKTFDIYENAKPDEDNNSARNFRRDINFTESKENIVKNIKNCITINFGSYWLIIGDEFMAFGSYIYGINRDINKKVYDCYVSIEKKKEPRIKWVTVGQHGYVATPRKVNSIAFDIDNYNDDIPVDRISEELSKDTSSLIMLYGEPGTGKTTFIRSMIERLPNKDFYYIDGRSLYHGDSQDLSNFLIDCKDAIFIIEDCETLITSRDQGNNALSTILNVTDGMLGDSLGIKFICTFNTNINNIDKAMCRKGRLKLQYEFKKLTKEKVANLFKKLNIEDNPREMSLCDIYNYEVDNGTKQTKKLGF